MHYRVTFVPNPCHIQRAESTALYSHTGSHKQLLVSDSRSPKYTQHNFHTYENEKDVQRQTSGMDTPKTKDFPESQHVVRNTLHLPTPHITLRLNDGHYNTEGNADAFETATPKGPTSLALQVSAPASLQSKSNHT
jgi:hypothetical protein